MVATTLPAVVRVVDLPVGTTVTGAELIEAVQTTAGVGVSVQLSLNQVFTSIGGVPTGGATGTILNKSSGSNYSTQFSAINTFVNIGTSLATTGSATSIVVFVANQGITSTQIANNAVGTNQVASSLQIASSLSVGGLLTVGGTATVTGTTVLNGGLQVTGTSLLTGTFGVVGTSLFTGTFGVVGTSIMTGVHGVVGTALFTSGTFGVVGTSNITGNFSVYPASNLGFDVNYNTGTFISPSAGDHIRLIGANGVQASIVAQGFGQNSILILSSSNGTLQAPTTVGADTLVGSVRSFPYNGSSYNVGSGFQFLTLNAQSTTDGSGYIKVLVAATGTVSAFESVRFQASGGVSIGTSTDPGIGRLAVNSGIIVYSGTTLFTTSFGVVGTSLMTGVYGVVGTALFTGAFGIVGTSVVTGSFILGNQTSGFVLSNATGVITATTSIAIGVRLVAFNAGTTSGNTSITFDSVNAPIQFLTNNGTGTLTAPSNDGELDVMVINTTNASTLTFSGFSVGSNTGDAYVTTTGQRFILSVRRINGSTTYRWASLQ